MEENINVTEMENTMVEVNEPVNQFDEFNDVECVTEEKGMNSAVMFAAGAVAGIVMKKTLDLAKPHVKKGIDWVKGRFAKKPKDAVEAEVINETEVKD